jgi:hypothetical protein
VAAAAPLIASRSTTAVVGAAVGKGEAPGVVGAVVVGLDVGLRVAVDVGLGVGVVVSGGARARFSRRRRGLHRRRSTPLQNAATTPMRSHRSPSSPTSRQTQCKHIAWGKTQRPGRVRAYGLCRSHRKSTLSIIHTAASAAVHRGSAPIGAHALPLPSLRPRTAPLAIARAELPPVAA